MRETDDRDPRLEDLTHRLRKIKDTQESIERQEAERFRDAENMGRGLRAGAELVSPIGAGALIGWLLDGWLETAPVFLILMLLLGIVTGFVNVWRMTQNIGGEIGYSELHRRAKKDKTPPED
jgi:ATP synthase protein I